MADLAVLIEQFLDSTQQLRQAVSGMSREQLLARPVAGKWSTLEVVCHVGDSDQAWIHRMKRVLSEENPLLIGYDEARFAKALAYHDRDLNDELDLIERMRHQWGRVLRAISPEQLKRTGVHNERGLITLEQMIQIETDHVTHHIRFIREKRKALGLPA